MPQPIVYPKEKQEIVVRYPGNPILKKDDVPAAAKGVYNSGCIKTKEGRHRAMSRNSKIKGPGGCLF